MLRDVWFSFLYRNLARFAFHQISTSGAAIPKQGPVLYVCLHRNGALDGIVYQQVVPQARATLSSQLRRSPLLRLIFDGIEFVRESDRKRDGLRVSNEQSFGRCAEHLGRGGQLLFFPEGTSELGPKHLKFRAGVAHLIQATLKRSPKLSVVPLAAHYEAPTEWQSDVEVEIGETIVFSGKPRAAEIMRAITIGLELVGLDCETREGRAATEALAYAATLGQKDIGYAQALHAMCGASIDRWEDVLSIAKADGLCLHQGVPLVPMHLPVIYLLAWLVLTPLIAAAAAMNLPIVVAAWLAPGRFADAPNVVSLWRSLAGVGAAYLWVPIVVATSLLLGGFIPAGGYVLLSLAGLRSLYRWKKLSITLWNWLRLGRQHAGALLAAHTAVVVEARQRIDGRRGG
jgi:1-acyl-sn-glycerol-3-phosphate acyltransferase